MSTSKVTVATPSDLEVRVTREFNAPPRLVWDAHTRPELVRRWMSGPDGWTLDVCEIDLRVGGAFRYEMQRKVDRSSSFDTPSGSDRMGWGGTYREIAAPERLVHTELFDEDWTGGETTVTILFKERAGGKTTLDMLILYVSREARDGALATGMTEGMEMAYGHLDALLETEASA